MLLKIPYVTRGRYLQLLCSICMSLSTLVFGIFVSWPSQTLPKLLSKDSPLASGPITQWEASLVNSLVMGGGVAGSIVFGLLPNRCGRKWPIISAGVIMVVSWVLIATAENVNYLYVSRFFSGLAAGGIRIFISFYICEIAENRIRGALASISGISFSLGMLLGSIITDSLPLHIAPYVPLALLGVFFLLILFPDSPHCLILNDSRVVQAEEALKFFRQMTPLDEIAQEFEQIKKSRDATGNSVTFQDFCSRGVLKGIVIILFIMSLLHFNGIQTLGTYSVIVLSQAGTSLNPNSVTSLFYTVQFVSYVSTAYILDRYGRRLTMIMALITNILCGLIFALYYYILNLEISIPQGCEWILILSFYGLAASGIILINVPTIISTELIPTKLRSMTGATFVTLQWLDGFAMTEFFLPATEAFGIHSCVLAFAFWNIIELSVVYFMLPETRGKSTHEINEILNKKKNKECDSG
ncbi:facilitated trehalose transporter Tret1-like [Phlebotomus papatasi]|uniref:facilitated trehalose transporter Tret1-like n=1 Tax=Phlebotomus papatasi TaxID=29031 RepID=UPI0024846E90|nr:facilitated trehalose transporter Tret1-like [Phlebotomus papatasi]